MIAFSPSPIVVEQQMNAIIFYLTTFGYIDGRLDTRAQSSSFWVLATGGAGRRRPRASWVR